MLVQDRIPIIAQLRELILIKNFKAQKIMLNIFVIPMLIYGLQ